MAVFEERTRLYEVLTRVNEDGSIASHVMYITEVLKDGEVLSASVEPPIAINPSDTQAYQIFTTVLGEACAANIVANQKNP